jgi:subtilisin-like proprotein convertase family protein
LARPELRDSLLVARTFNLALPDRETKEASIEVTEAQAVSGLCVHVELLHTYIGDLVITLLPPPAVGGPPVFLHKRAGGATRNLKRIYDHATTPDLARFQNLSCAGRWTLRISDQADADHGTLVNFGVQLHFAS